MAQYCRYCGYLVTGNGIYCEAKEKELSEAYTKGVNHCKSFDFCSMDAYDLGKFYQPRQKRAPVNQISIEDIK